MRGESSVTVDLESLTLRSGEAAKLDLTLRPEPPVVGGEELALGAESIAALVDISRTTSGYAMRLRAEIPVDGHLRPLSRGRRSDRLDRLARGRAGRLGGLGDAQPLRRRPGSSTSSGWAHDALRLALPERLLCRPDCAGLCEVCGISLNSVDPAEHRHERPRDPRFARLGELLE